MDAAPILERGRAEHVKIRLAQGESAPVDSPSKLMHPAALFLSRQPRRVKITFDALPRPGIKRVFGPDERHAVVVVQQVSRLVVVAILDLQIQLIISRAGLEITGFVLDAGAEQADPPRAHHPAALVQRPHVLDRAARVARMRPRGVQVRDSGRIARLVERQLFARLAINVVHRPALRIAIPAPLDPRRVVKIDRRHQEKRILHCDSGPPELNPPQPPRAVVDEMIGVRPRRRRLRHLADADDLVARIEIDVEKITRLVAGSAASLEDASGEFAARASKPVRVSKKRTSTFVPRGKNRNG